jgi:hypothetical protein
MFLRFHRLAEDGFPPAILLFHGPGRFFDVVEGLGFDRGGMGDHRLRLRVDLEHRRAARAGHLES